MAVDPRQLLHYACVARAAYEGSPSTEQQLACLGYRLESEWRSGSAEDGLYALAAGNDQEVVLAWQGTRDVREALIDADVLVTKFYGTRFRSTPLVHTGFLHYWEESSAWAKGIDLRGRRLVLAGHSLGAAVATLAAVVLEPQAVWTYGSPRVGLPAFGAIYNAGGFESHRVVHDQDIVPHLPAWPYYHVAGGILLDQTGQEGMIPDEAPESRLKRVLADLDGQALRDHRIDSYIACAQAAIALHGAPS